MNTTQLTIKEIVASIYRFEQRNAIIKSIYGDNMGAIPKRIIDEIAAYNIQLNYLKSLLS